MQLLVAYAADGPLGANLRRTAYRVLDPGVTVAAMDADESGNVVVAGSTTSGLVYSGPLESAPTMRIQAVGPERAVATHNPTGNLLKLPDFKALPPTRLVDTRPGAAQGAIAVTKQKYGGANTLQIRIAGVAGVPANGASAVALNVTVVSPDNAGYLTAYPCGTPPNVSNLNFSQNQTVPNAVIAPLSANGEACFYASADTHLLVDVNGWFAT